MSRSNHFYWNARPIEWWTWGDNGIPECVIIGDGKPLRRIAGRRPWTRKSRYPDYGIRSQGPPPKSLWRLWRRAARARMNAEMRRNPIDPMIHKDHHYFNLDDWY